MTAPSVYITSVAGSLAAELIAELFACPGDIAYAMLQPNPRLYMADRLDEIAAESEGPAGEIERLRAAATTLREVHP